MKNAENSVLDILEFNIFWEGDMPPDPHSDSRF